MLHNVMKNRDKVRDYKKTKKFLVNEYACGQGLSKTQTLQQLSNSNQTGFIGFSLMFSRLKIKLNKIVSQLGRCIKVLLLSKETVRSFFLNNKFVYAVFANIGFLHQDF